MDESVVDLACGVGELCSRVPGDYFGIDNNKDYINFAKGRYSGKFACADIFKYKYKKYDVAICSCTLHHFDDKDNIRILKLMSRIAKRAYIVDGLPGKTLLQKLFVKFDKGKYFRTLGHQRLLIEKYFNIEEETELVTPSGSVRLIVYKLSNKKV